MSVETNRTVMMQYFESDHSDVSMMAEDVVFTDMATGQEHHGPDGVRQMLNYVYHIAFEATAVPQNLIISENNAVWEGDFIGKHIGEFAGIPATGKVVNVPLTIVYDLADGRITRARIYLMAPVLMQQLGIT